MRRPFTIAVSLILLASSAAAQKKPKAGKKEPEKPGVSMASTGADPAESEKSDDGPFAPEGKTGELAEKQEQGEEVKEVEKGRARDKIVVFGEVLIGFGKVVLPSPTHEATRKGTSVTLMAGGTYDFSPALTAGLRVPWTTATIKQPNQQNLGSQALGAPEIFGEYRVSLNKLTSVPITFGLGVPVAQGNPDLTSKSSDGAGVAQDEVNRMADAASGWKDSELFQPKRLPIVVGAGIRHERRAFELHAHAKFVLLPALNTDVKNPNDPDGAGTYKINGFALREVTSLGGSYNFLDDPVVYAGLDFALVWSAIHTVEFESSQNATPPSRLQAVLEPRVGARFGIVSPSVSYVAPPGGRLGEAGVGGIRLHVDVAF